jgi:glycosyltransferase involved in cell wall biosynthesis
MMEIEENLGFRSSYNFVPERYDVSEDLRTELVSRGFEVGVHGLRHDGMLFASEQEFIRRAVRINHYLKAWGATGFRAPAMHRNFKWMSRLDIEYDMSTFDTDPFEPNPDHVGTIFPFWITGEGGQTQYLEMPYTLPQDYTLYVILKERTLDTWKRKLAWIVEKGGMALLNTHPDYCSSGVAGKEEYSIALYREFLEYVREEYAGQYYHAIPRQIADHFKHNPETINKFHAKKICMLGYTFYESDNRVMRYAETLASRGDQVDVIALRSSVLPQDEVLRGINVYRIQKRLQNESGEWSYLLRTILFFVRSWHWLLCNKTCTRYDLVHVHNMPDFLIFAACPARMRGAKLILDIHDLVPEYFASKFRRSGNAFSISILRWLEGRSARIANHVIVSNHIWADTIEQRSVGSDQCSVLLNYPDPAIFYPRERQDHGDSFVLIYPGSFGWHQGLDVAIRAMAILKDEIPNASLHIYGGGREKDELKQLIADLDLAQRVVLHEGRALREIAEVMAQADLGLVPKRSDSFGNEAFSTKILEFMASGIPVVASNTRIDQYYFDDTCISFFESGNERDLARAIERLYRDPELMRSQARHALEFVEQHSWGVKFRGYHDLVDSLMNRD